MFTSMTRQLFCSGRVSFKNVSLEAYERTSRSLASSKTWNESLTATSSSMTYTIRFPTLGFLPELSSLITRRS